MGFSSWRALLGNNGREGNQLSAIRLISLLHFSLNFLFFSFPSWPNWSVAEEEEEGAPETLMAHDHVDVDVDIL